MEDLIMKKSIVCSLALVAAFSMIASCEKEQGTIVPETVEQAVEGELITISATIPEGALTKVALEQDDSDYDAKLNLTWSAGDQIVVTDATNPSNTQTFTLKDGEEGKTTAQFTGAALAAASSYNISYNGAGGLDYANQTQAADASTAHLKYAATLTGVNDYESISFTQAWATSNGGGTFASSSVLRLRAKLPSGEAPFDDITNLKAVIFKSSAPIFAGAKEMKVNITDASDEGELDILTVYASLPVGDQPIAAGTDLLVQFQMSANAYDKYTAYRNFSSANTLQGGKVNYLNLNCENIMSFANAKTDINGDDTDDIGTSINPYLIGDQHQLAKMKDEVSGGVITYFTLVDDVDLTGVAWVPFNYASSYNNGVYFDGKNHTISNLTVTDATDYPSFAGVVYGTIKDVTFDGANITSTDSNAGVLGGYVGTGSYNGVCSGVTVSNASVTVTVGASKKGRHAGAIAGQVGTAGSSFDDCHVTGTTTITSNTNNTAPDSNPNSNAGGFVGFSDKAFTATSCTVSGNVEVTMNTGRKACSVGGFIGNIGANASFSDCTAAADIENTNSYYTGGFVGQIGSAVSPTFNSCAFLGGTLTAGRNSTANSPVAGFVGRITAASSASFTDCYVDGVVITASNSGRCGGFVGDSGSNAVCPTFTGCYVKNSSISAAQHCGGFAGVFYAIADKCYVEATTITAGNSNNGGFVGYLENAEITNCYATATVIGGSNANNGGFIGNSRNGAIRGVTVTSCFENGTVSGSAASVGAFIGAVTVKDGAITKCIAWDASLSFIGSDGGLDTSSIDNNYTGTSGTISAQATTLGWDGDVWDLTGSVPTLK